MPAECQSIASAEGMVFPVSASLSSKAGKQILSWMAENASPTEFHIVCTQSAGMQILHEDRQLQYELVTGDINDDHECSLSRTEKNSIINNIHNIVYTRGYPSTPAGIPGASPSSYPSACSRHRKQTKRKKSNVAQTMGVENTSGNCNKGTEGSGPNGSGGEDNLKTDEDTRNQGESKGTDGWMSWRSSHHPE